MPKKIVRYNISKPKKYTNKTGEEKTQWNNIGTLTEFHNEDGRVSRIVEIPAIGLEASAFLQEPRNPNGTLRPKQENSAQSAELDAGGEIDANDLPF